MKRAILPFVYVAATLPMLTADLSQAADIVWTNLAGGNWNNPTNWSPNLIPGATDNAFITNSGTYTVTLNVAASVTNLTLGATNGTQTFIISSPTFTLNGDSFVGTNGIFKLDGGATLTGVGNLNVAGTFNWTGGTMSGTGKTVITNGAALNVTGASFQKILNRHLDLFGTGTYDAGNFLYGGNGITWNIFSGASFTITGDQNMPFSGGALPVINNASFGLGGTAAGTYDAAGAGTVINFGGGTHSVTNGASFTASGGGFFRCDNGNLNFDVPFSFNPTFQLTANGSLAGNQTANFTSTFNWTGGTMSGTGKTVITNGAALNVTGASFQKILNRHLDLFGAGTYDAGNFLYGGNGITWNIFSGASFTITGDQNMPFSGGALPVINNAHDQLSKRLPPEQRPDIALRRQLPSVARRHQRRLIARRWRHQRTSAQQWQCPSGRTVQYSRCNQREQLQQHRHWNILRPARRIERGRDPRPAARWRHGRSRRHGFHFLYQRLHPRARHRSHSDDLHRQVRSVFQQQRAVARPQGSLHE